jgi:hypothetical protein
MKITICGSMKFYIEMRAIQEALSVLGHDAVTPLGTYEEVPIEARTDITEEEIVNAKIEYDFIREHFKKVSNCDGVLILNYEKKGIPGYIGGNTFLEMGIAFWLNKKIYLMHPVPSMDYATEMHAMQPIILDGDLSKIV